MWYWMSVFEGRQLTAARALAGLTIEGLAVAAGVTKRTVARLEASAEIHVAAKLRHGHVSRVVWDKIVRVLAERGVEFEPEVEGRGAGVRWTAPRAARQPQRQA
jgi:predicted transcriptional regulator